MGAMRSLKGKDKEPTGALVGPSSSSSSSSSLASKARDFRVFVKRDDETGCILGGNKIRKLEFILAEALRQKKDAVITIGGIQSNHCRITSNAARLVGLQSHLILRTDTADAKDEGVLTGNILLDRMVGANVHLVSLSDYRSKGQHRLVEGLRSQLERQGIDAYPTPVGGSDAIGAWGYLMAAEELRTQLQAMPVPITDIVITIGSGGSAEGLSLGLHLAKLDIRVHAVAVSDSARYFYNHCGEFLREMGVTDVTPEELFDVVDDFTGRGYSKATPAELACQRWISQSTGVLTDPTYTGKALVGLCVMMDQNPDRFKGENILFWHTGGIFGVFGRSEGELAETYGKGVDDLVSVLDVSDF